MGDKLSKRKKVILNALFELGGKASVREIAERTNLNANGISQTLGRMEDIYVRYHGYVQRSGVYELIEQSVDQFYLPLSNAPERTTTKRRASE